MRAAALVLCGALLLAPGCGSRATAPADAGADGHADAAPPQDGSGADRHFDGPAGDTLATDAPGADAPAQVDASRDGTVVAPDGGEPTTACATAGGLLCTPVRWEICPAGTEPLGGADSHLGCGLSGSGWCCQLAPASTCSQSGQGNCVPGVSCTGCWGAVPGLACEAGRVCCEDVCG